MENQRAIEILKLRLKMISSVNIDAIISYNMAIKSLEKQIPFEINNDKLHCKCGNSFTNDELNKFKYCNKCGQRLKFL